MSRTRVYVPWSLDRLAGLVRDQRAGRRALVLPAEGEAHGVTDALRAEFPDADEEELEYLAMTAAAQRSVALVDDEGPYERMVLAVDVDSTRPLGSEDPTLVAIGGPALLGDLVSVHVDSGDAAPDVRAARSALAEDATGAEEPMTRCLDHELGWYAATELEEIAGRAAEEHRRPAP